jgi:hypothetical protein
MRIIERMDRNPASPDSVSGLVINIKPTRINFQTESMVLAIPRCFSSEADSRQRYQFRSSHMRPSSLARLHPIVFGQLEGP